MQLDLCSQVKLSQEQTSPFQPPSGQFPRAKRLLPTENARGTSTLFPPADFPVRLGDLVLALGHSSPSRERRRETLCSCCT